MDGYISLNESPLDDLEVQVTDDGAKYIDHGPIFAKLDDNVFAKFGFNAQNFLPDSYCWWMTYIADDKQVDDKPIQLVTLSLISSRLEHKGNFVKFLTQLVKNTDIDWLIIPWPSNRMIEIACKFGFVAENHQGERLILDCNEWRKRQGQAQGL